MRLEWVTILRKIRSSSVGIFIQFVGITLSFIGLIVLFSTTQYSNIPYFTATKQFLWFSVSLLMGTTVAFSNLDKLRQSHYVFPAIACTFILLVLVLFVGPEINGAKRWLDFGFLKVQVSDFAKITLIFYLAHYLGLNQRELKAFKQGFLIPCMLIGSSALLIGLQPDYGTALLVALVGVIMLFLAGVRISYLLPSMFLAICLFVFIIINNPERCDRLISFLYLEENFLIG